MCTGNFEQFPKYVNIIENCLTNIRIIQKLWLYSSIGQSNPIYSKRGGIWLLGT